MLADRDRFLLELPPRPGYLGAARLFVAALAGHYRCDAVEIEDLKVAVSEACTNALVDRRSRRSEEPIRVTAAAGGDRLLFRIEDGGARLSGLQDPGRTDEPSTEQLARIMGTTLIHSLFPDAVIEEVSDGGLDLTLSIATGPETDG